MAEAANSAEKVIYTALGPQDHDTSHLPLNSNSLIGTEKAAGPQYSVCLSESEIKGKTVLFGTTLLLFCLVALVAHIVAYFQHSHLSQKALLIHIASLLSLGGLGSVLTISTFSFPRIQKSRKSLFLAYSLCLVAYLVLGDQRLLSNWTQTPYSNSHSDYTEALLLFLYLYMRFSYFLGMVLLSASVLCLYCPLMLVYSPQDGVATAANCVYLALYCLWLCFQAYEMQFRPRSAYYCVEKEENTVIPIGNKPVLSVGISTATEELIDLCNTVTIRLKSIVSGPISNLNSQLKDTFQLIDQIKLRLAAGKLHEIDHLDPSNSLDEEDREFIRQQVGHRPALAQGVEQLVTRLIAARMPREVRALGRLETAVGEVGATWGFDVWVIQGETGQSISLIGKFLFKKWELWTDLKVTESVSQQFFHSLEASYRPNPYHNACHGADVCHSFLYFLCTSRLLPSLSSLELATCIIASLGHDVNHAGLNNRFLVASKDKLAMRYNDSNVLENMHVAFLYKLMQRPEGAILSGLKYEDWANSRKLIIDLILSTDMSRHFETLGQFRTRAQAQIALSTTSDKALVLAMGLKCADVGHTAKPSDLHIKWSELVCEEFFQQGDLEKAKGQQVSMYCDRETTDIAKSQAGFLRNMTLPLYEAWVGYLDTAEVTEQCLVQMNRNLKHWESKVNVKRAGLMLLSSAAGKLGAEVRKGLDQAVQAEKD